MLEASSRSNGGIHLRGLASDQHSSEEPWQRWRAVDDAVLDLTGPGVEPTTSCTNSDVLQYRSNQVVNDKLQTQYFERCETHQGFQLAFVNQVEGSDEIIEMFVTSVDVRFRSHALHTTHT